MLPGSRGVLFASEEAGVPQINLLELDTGQHEVIIPNGTDPHYSPTGHIVYALEGTLRAMAFDLEALRVTSDPVPVVEDVLTKTTGSASFDLSDTGSLVYVSGFRGAGNERSFVWVDRDGREEPLPLPAALYRTPRVSPDGTRVAVDVVDQTGSALWVYNVATGRGLRLTQEGSALAPVWTPDSQHIVFAFDAGDGNLYDPFWVRADGSGPAERLWTSEEYDGPSGITPDGGTVLLSRASDPQRLEVWELPLDGDHTPTPLLTGDFIRSSAEVTPDGNWLVYDSNDSGEREIYVQSYPNLGPRFPVSLGGGRNLVISPDGSELFYRLGTAVMAVDLNTEGGTVSLGRPGELFDGGYLASTIARWYHIAPDGRFLMQRAGDAQPSESNSPTQVVLVQNWFQELTERVPTP